MAGEKFILGIESSCDETAVAVVSSRRRILADIILSQIAEHAPYGGVVPEIAARSHIEHLGGLIGAAMAEADMPLAGLDAIAATAGPGLLGGVLVGLVAAKGLALGTGRPLLAINHLEGHALSARLLDDIAFPYLLLLVSGGHCQLLIVEGVGQYRLLGSTLDDAVGEAFDKVAKMLGLGYPGGPAVEEAARTGNGTRFALPRPLLSRRGCDFSFSGLKTAVARLIERDFAGRPTTADRHDIAAAFEAAVGDVVVEKLRRACAIFRRDWPRVASPALVMAGGVAANKTLRQRVGQLAQEEDFSLSIPPIRLCTDNGAMIAWAGAERLALGGHSDLGVAARARWPLAELEPPPGL